MNKSISEQLELSWREIKDYEGHMMKQAVEEIIKLKSYHDVFDDIGRETFEKIAMDEEIAIKPTESRQDHSNSCYMCYVSGSKECKWKDEK